MASTSIASFSLPQRPLKGAARKIYRPTAPTSSFNSAASSAANTNAEPCAQDSAHDNQLAGSKRKRISDTEIGTNGPDCEENCCDDLQDVEDDLSAPDRKRRKIAPENAVNHKGAESTPDASPNDPVSIKSEPMLVDRCADATAPPSNTSPSEPYSKPAFVLNLYANAFSFDSQPLFIQYDHSSREWLRAIDAERLPADLVELLERERQRVHTGDTPLPPLPYVDGGLWVEVRDFRTMPIRPPVSPSTSTAVAASGPAEPSKEGKRGVPPNSVGGAGLVKAPAVTRRVFLKPDMESLLADIAVVCEAHPEWSLDDCLAFEARLVAAVQRRPLRLEPTAAVFTEQLLRNYNDKKFNVRRWTKHGGVVSPGSTAPLPYSVAQSGSSANAATAAAGTAGIPQNSVKRNAAGVPMPLLEFLQSHHSAPALGDAAKPKKATQPADTEKDEHRTAAQKPSAKEQEPAKPYTFLQPPPMLPVAPHNVKVPTSLHNRVLKFQRKSAVGAKAPSRTISWTVRIARYAAAGGGYYAVIRPVPASSDPSVGTTTEQYRVLLGNADSAQRYVASLLSVMDKDGYALYSDTAMSTTSTLAAASGQPTPTPPGPQPPTATATTPPPAAPVIGMPNLGIPAVPVHGLVGASSTLPSPATAPPPNPLPVAPSLSSIALRHAGTAAATPVQAPTILKVAPSLASAAAASAAPKAMSTQPSNMAASGASGPPTGPKLTLPQPHDKFVLMPGRPSAATQPSTSITTGAAATANAMLSGQSGPAIAMGMPKKTLIGEHGMLAAGATASPAGPSPTAAGHGLGNPPGARPPTAPPPIPVVTPPVNSSANSSLLTSLFRQPPMAGPSAAVANTAPPSAAATATAGRAHFTIPVASMATGMAARQPNTGAVVLPNAMSTQPSGAAAMSTATTTAGPRGATPLGFAMATPLSALPLAGSASAVQPNKAMVPPTQTQQAMNAANPPNR